jgi:hypothetical protein
LPGLLQEIYDFCYISKEFIGFTTDQGKPQYNQVIPTLSRDRERATCLRASHGHYDITCSIQSALLSCREHKVTATSTKISFISQHASANPTTNKLFVDVQSCLLGCTAV